MWYIFPQLAGLGSSPYAQRYAIPDLAAARAYMADPYLRSNLLTITQALLALDETNPVQVLGWPDNLKLRSSMTLFELASPEEAVFGQVLDKFYEGSRDAFTLEHIR